MATQYQNQLKLNNIGYRIDTSGMGPNYVQTHTDTIPHQQKLLPKQPIHRPVAPNRRVGKDKQSNEIICIDSDDEADDGLCINFILCFFNYSYLTEGIGLEACDIKLNANEH